MAKAFFITGTDTEVGKTYPTCALLHRARQAGLTAAGLKAVAAGVDASGKNEDVEALRAASSPELTLPESIRNPYLFSPAIAPHIAAREACVKIEFAVIEAAVQQALQQADVVLLEGAGGFRIPLGTDGDSADLAQKLGLPVMLVVGMRLGCLNHALLTAEAILARRLSLAGWIANNIRPDMPFHADNLATLKTLIPAPLLGVIPHALPGGVAAAARGLDVFEE
ncbi:ATP-dependent dethiobiotin synthetase BioD [Betaproteobacteria bacterium]|nr:ATP-dependent dethiobiotin synthetase BioD [Betaproteobacteria bacterium]